MEIILESSAQKYITKKSPEKAITLSVGRREGAHCGCSVGGGVYPSVKLGVSPFDVDNYNNANIDGIRVYYPDAVSDAFRAVIIKIEGILFYKQLLALGR